MHIRIHIGSTRLFLEPLLPRDLAKDLQKATRYHPKGYQHTHKFQKGGWDGWSTAFFLRDQSAPAGCYLRIKKFLKKEGHSVEVKYLNDYPATGEVHIANLPGPLDPTQLKAIKDAAKHKVGIINAVIRSGKTAIIAGILSKLNNFPAWVVTHTDKSLMKQIRTSLASHLEHPVGQFFSGKFVEEDVIVTSYQALGLIYKDPKKAKQSQRKYSEKVTERNNLVKESVKDAKVLILDECQYAFSPKSRLFLNEFKNTGYRIGLSGTPKPDGITRREMEAVIGPIINTISFKKMIEKGRLAQPVVFLYDLPRKWFRVHLQEYSDVYDANITENYYRNLFIKQLVRYLWKKGKTSYVMVRRKAHGEILSELIPEAVYLYGDVNEETRKLVYERLKQKDLPCIISTVGKVGLDLPQLDAVINAEGLEASTITIQKMRSLTAHSEKEVGIVVDFIDKGMHLLDHSVTRMNKYYSLKGFIIKEKKVPNDHFKKEEQES